MKKTLALAIALFAFALASFAAAPKTYQVTGIVKSVTSDMIVVEKGSDLWQIARAPGEKVTGDVKPGAKVTIEYRMTATTITAKAENAPAKKK